MKLSAPLAFPLRLDGIPAPVDVVVPKKQSFIGGIRFANKRVPNWSAVDFTGIARVTINSICQVNSAPADKKSLSGVIGNRFGNRRGLTPKGGVFAKVIVPPGPGSLFRSPTPIPNSSNGPLSINRVYTISQIFPSDAAVVELSGTNRTFAAGVADVTSSMALYTSAGSGYPVSPSLQDFTMNLPGNGTWATRALGQPTFGSDRQLVLFFNFPDPQFAQSPNTQLGYYTESNLVVDPPQAFTGVNPSPNFWFEFSYQTSKRKLIILGDSISLGYSTGPTVGFLSASWNDYATQNDVAVSIHGVVQYGSLQVFALPATYPFLWDSVNDIIPGNDVVIQLGTNDLLYNDLPTMQNYLQTIISYLQARSVRKIYAWTVPPQTGYVGTETVRTGYNSWLIANSVSLGLSGVYDAAASQAAGGLADNVNPTIIYSGFDTGDGTHPNIAGQLQMMNGWGPVIA